MAWVLLFVAGLLEVGWSIGMKYTDGFTRLWPSVFTGAGIVASMMLLSYAARTLPIGTAYGVWVGIGAAGAAVLGMVVLGSRRPPPGSSSSVCCWSPWWVSRRPPVTDAWV